MAVSITEVRDWVKGLPFLAQAFLHKLEQSGTLTSDQARVALVLRTIAELDPQVWVPLRAGFGQWAAGHGGVELQLFSTERTGTFRASTHKWTWVWKGGNIFPMDPVRVTSASPLTVVGPRQVPRAPVSAQRPVLTTATLRAALQAAPNKTLSLVEITNQFPDADYNIVEDAAKGDRKIFQHQGRGGMSHWCYRG